MRRTPDLAGPRSQSRLRVGLQTAALAGLLVMLLSIPGQVVVGTWMSQEAMKRDWTIKGPACPEVDQAQRSAVGSRLPKTFDYAGVAFTRYFGHVSCVAFRDHGLFDRRTTKVCQFNGPGAVGVSVAGRTSLYQPGVGRPATVTVRDGMVSCVVAAWFRF